MVIVASGEDQLHVNASRFGAAQSPALPWPLSLPHQPRRLGIALNGEPAGLVNNVCAVSDVAPGYAPEGRALISVSVLGLPNHQRLEEKVRHELHDWFGSQVDRWEHIQTDRIPRALPEHPPRSAPSNSPGFQEHDGILICGDHCTTPSIEGALVSGLKTADALVPLAS